nr:acyltransferase family protein [Mesorhizobium sp.]
MGGAGQFREDINGLRAIAVLGVIFFHLGIDEFRGGFLGVDVFFVISGYLITKSILRQAEERVFSFGAFYYGRARRLFPALLSTVAATALAGLVILAPSDLRDLAESAIYSLAWLSNIYFWLDTDYFAAEAGTKALLHTWSLGVEEQFYLVWPVVVLLSFKMAGRKGVAVAMLCSIILGAIATAAVGQMYPAATFFLTPFRVFEFAIGGMVVFTETKFRPPRIITEVVVTVALVIIVASFVLVDRGIPVPLGSAIAICLAVAAVIQVGRTAHVGIVLSNRFSAFFGRISYSLYLVHWPIVVLYEYAVFREIGPVEMAVVFAATVAFGWLLHVVVEQKFRYYDFKGVTVARYGALASIGAAFLLSGLIWYGQGWPWRSSHYFEPGFVHYHTQTHRYETLTQTCRSRKAQDCWSIPDDIDDKKLVLVAGDSHGPDGFNMIYPALKDEHLVLNQWPGCPPVVETSPLVLDGITPPKCNQLNKERTSKEYLANFDVVVVSVLWAWYKPSDLAEFISVAKDANPQVKFIVFGNYLVTNTLCWQILERKPHNGCFADEYITSKFLYEDELRRVVSAHGGLFLSKKDVMCDAGGCRLFADEAGTIPFTWDMHHLSYEFAGLIGEAVRERVLDYVNGTSRALD